MKNTRLITFFFAVVLFSACSKNKTETAPNNSGSNNNNGNNNPAKTPQELIIGKWQFVSIVYTDHGEDPLADCDKDNFLDIQQGGIYSVDNGTIKCDPTDDQRAPGKWTMDSYPTIHFKLDHLGAEGTTDKIIQLSNSTLKLLQYEGEPNIEHTITFKRM